MFEHVLVAIDFSPAWPRVRQRLDLLKALGVSRATLVYVMSSRYPAAPEEGHRAHYEQRLAEEVAGLAEIGIEADFRIAVGEPGRELVRAGKKAGTDLLLLGTRGHGKLHEFLVGSTALDTARLTHLPLWLEPVQGEFVESRNTVLLATDGSANAASAEAVFEALASRFQRCVAVTACSASENAGCEMADAEKHLAELAGRVDGLETRIEQADPRDAIIALAREMPADLTLVGKRGRNIMAELLLGSTAEAVCRRVHRPVLLVPCRG